MDVMVVFSQLCPKVNFIWQRNKTKSTFLLILHHIERCRCEQQKKSLAWSPKCAHSKMQLIKIVLFPLRTDRHTRGPIQGGTVRIGLFTFLIALTLLDSYFLGSFFPYLLQTACTSCVLMALTGPYSKRHSLPGLYAQVAGWLPCSKWYKRVS